MKKRFRWKRLVQIRLATLLMLVTLCAAALGFRQAFIVPYQRQDAAVQRIKKVNAPLAFTLAQPAWLVGYWCVGHVSNVPSLTNLPTSARWKRTPY